MTLLTHKGRKNSPSNLKCNYVNECVNSKGTFEKMIQFFFNPEYINVHTYCSYIVHLMGFPRFSIFWKIFLLSNCLNPKPKLPISSVIFHTLNIGFHWVGNQFNDNLKRYGNLKGYERKLVLIFN